MINVGNKNENYICEYYKTSTKKYILQKVYKSNDIYLKNALIITIMQIWRIY